MTKARLMELRAVAGRLFLSTPGERMLRGLVIELVTELVGDRMPSHPDLVNSGAMYPVPEISAPPPPLQYQTTSPAPAPAPAPPAARPLTMQRPPVTIDQAARAALANGRTSAPPIGSGPVARPGNGLAAAPHLARVPDPESDEFLSRLQQQLDDEDSEPPLPEGA